VVPLGIVTIGIGIYLIFTYLAGGPARGTAEIIKDLREGGPNGRSQAALELAEVLRRNPDALKNPALVRQLMEAYEAIPAEGPRSALLEAGSPLHIKILIVQCLSLVADPVAVPLLLKEAKGGQEELKPYCIGAIGACGDTGAVPDLIAMLDSESPTIRKYAANALGMLRDSRAVAALRARLGDSKTDVQWNAACVLGFYFRDPDVVPILKSMLDRPSVERAVGSNEYSRELIVQAMVTAMNAVVALKDESCRPALQAISSSDPDQKVRIAAQQALAKLGK
jgi:HEAT repeat protein